MYQLKDGLRIPYIVPDVKVLMERITAVGPGTVVGHRVCRHDETRIADVSSQETL